jgi:hypothetical protein
MDRDEIIHIAAKNLFVCIIDRNEKRGTAIMTQVIAMGPQSSLRFLGELSNKVDQFRAYLGDCVNYGLCDTKSFDCALRRFCECQKNGQNLIKVGEWD